MIGEEGSEGVNTLDVVGKGRQLAMPDQRMSVDLYIMLFPECNHFVSKVKIVGAPLGVNDFSLHDILRGCHIELLRNQCCCPGIFFFDLLCI